MIRLGELATFVLVLGGLTACSAALKLTPSDADVVLAHQLLDAPNPAHAGHHVVHTLYYGSGTDRRRAEFRDSVTIKTDSVDASKLIDLRESAKERNRYWGFEPKNFPLNGRVWYPDGAGPFPLVLIVHGNHNPRDFSDPGYGYLGELLASRGFILTSVDMNFVNGGVRGENDARGWLLLKHLEVWREFNATHDNLFYGKVDLERIALIGHSRGGEAVGHAAAFNRLSYYPDDASVKFAFNFAIRSIIAIAPVDGQYLPTGRPVPVENVNYLVFHGSHDGDVSSFHGLRLYHRVKFTDHDTPYFKAAAYVYRANHGQWNTIWNNKDNGPRSGRILDLRPLITPEEQREFGKLYIAGFLEATLHDDDRYLPMFRDHRVIGGWLPKTMYITRFQTSSFRPLATFEEDIDITTGSTAGVRLQGDSLGRWREAKLMLRSRNRSTTSGSQENQAVWLGWNNEVQGKPDTLAEPASYTVNLPTRLARDWDLKPGTTLDFLLAATKDKPSARKLEGDSTVTDEAEERDRDRSSRDGTDDETDDTEPIDLTVVVLDSDGDSARVPLSRYGPIRKPLEISILRRKDQESQRFADNFDLILQSYSILLRDFVTANPRFDVARLQAISFLFDRVVAGTVVVDDIGLSDLPPGFTRVSAADP
jgi:dienelactone hydrolase